MSLVANKEGNKGGWGVKPKYQNVNEILCVNCV